MICHKERRESTAHLKPRIAPVDSLNVDSNFPLCARTNRGGACHFDDETTLFTHSRSSEASERVENSARLPRSARGESQNDHVSGDVQFQLGDDDFYQVTNESISGNIYDHRLATAEGDKHGNGGHLTCKQVAIQKGAGD